MTDMAEAINNMAKAIEKLASAIEGAGCSIAEDEPLNYSLSRGLKQVAEAIYGGNR